MKNKRTLNKVIEIYKHFQNKYNLYRKEYLDFITYEIYPVLESGVLEIPYFEDNRGILIYKFYDSYQVDDGKRSWTHSNEIIIPNNRENNLDWLLCDRNFSLGQKFDQLRKRKHNSYHFITKVLKNILSEYCIKNIKTSDAVINITIDKDTFTLIKKDPYNDWSSYDLVTTNNFVLDNFEIDLYSKF